MRFKKIGWYGNIIPVITLLPGNGTNLADCLIFNYPHLVSK